MPDASAGRLRPALLATRTIFLACIAVAMLTAAVFAASASGDVDMTGRIKKVSSPLSHKKGGGVEPFATSANGTYRCEYEYSSIANWYYYFSIGNCRPGWEIEVVSYASENSVTHEHSYGGFINHAFSGCGWIDTRFPVEKINSNTHTACAGGGSSREFKIEESTFMEKYNRGTVGDGNPVINTKPCPEYANYRPWSTSNVEKELIRTVPAYAASGSGSNYPALKWRYVTKYASTDGTGKYVMVRDDRIEGAGEGNWIFVPLSCLKGGSSAELPENAEERLPPPPTAVTGEAIPVGTTSATLHAAVNPNSLDTHYYIEWGKEASSPYEAFAPTPYPGGDVGSGTTSEEHIVTATGLSPNTTYYFRTVASSARGTAEGALHSFHTKPEPPSATTLEAGSISEEGVLEAAATLNGSVNPRGDGTTYYFQWGLSTAYGSSTPTGSAGSGNTAVPVSAALTGLPGGTAYHFRLVATNEAGETTYGTDQTLKTPLSPTAQLEPGIEGRLEMYVEGPNHSLWQYWPQAGVGWHTTQIANENTTYSTPRIEKGIEGRLEIYVQGPNHTLWQYRLEGAAWHGTQVAGENSIYSSPYLQKGIEGHLEMYVVGAHHSLWQYWPEGGTWHSLELAGENTTYSTPYLQEGIEGHLEMYIQGGGHSLWQYWPQAGVGWHSFELAGENTTYSTELRLEKGIENHLEMYVQGAHHALWQYWPEAGVGWHSFQVTSENTVFSNPYIEHGIEGHLEMYVQGANHSLWQIWPETGVGWHSFEILGENTTFSKPYLQTGIEGHLEMFIQGTEQSLWQVWPELGTGWHSFELSGNAFS